MGSIKKRVKREHVVGPKLMIKARLGVMSRTLGVSIQLLENSGAGSKDRSLKKLVNFVVVVGKLIQGWLVATSRTSGKSIGCRK